MDAINLLPLKPMEATPPRARTDTASEQDAPGFSFENMLDERNPRTPYHPPLEVEEPGADAPVRLAERSAAAGSAGVSTLVAMFSTLPALLPPEVAPAAFGEEAALAVTEPGDDAPVSVVERGEAADSAEVSTLVAMFSTLPSLPQLPLRPETAPAVLGEEAAPGTPAEGSAPRPAGPVSAPPTPDRKESAVLEYKLPRTIVPAPAKSRVATASVEQTIPQDASATLSETVAPLQESALEPREVAPIPQPEPIPNPTAFPAGYAEPRPAVPNEVMASASSQAAPVTAPAPRRTTLRGETVNAAAPLAAPSEIAAERVTSPVGITEVPLEGEIFNRELPVQERRPFRGAHGNVPELAQAAMANIPDGVEIEVVGTEIGAASGLSPFAEASPKLTLQVRPENHVEKPQFPQLTRPEGTTATPDKNPVPTITAGTSTATQERVMPDSFQPRVPEPKTAGPAANFNAAEPAMPTIGARMDGNSPFQNRPDADARQEEKSAFQQQPGEVAVSAPTLAPALANPFNSTARATTEPAAITRTDVETIVHRTVEAAERLRVTGGERVEVQVRLEAGQELTVRLHFTNGEVKPVFLTESQELRRAIEQNWAQFSERTSDRSTRVTTPIFETPNSQSGMNDLNQRQREGRERNFSQAQAEAFAAANAPGRNAQRRPSVSGPTLTTPAGLQIYA